MTPPMTDEQLKHADELAAYYAGPHALHEGRAKTDVIALARYANHLRSRLAAAERERDEAERLRKHASEAFYIVRSERDKIDHDRQHWKARAESAYQDGVKSVADLTAKLASVEAERDFQLSCALHQQEQVATLTAQRDQAVGERDLARQEVAIFSKACRDIANTERETVERVCEWIRSKESVARKVGARIYVELTPGTSTSLTSALREGEWRQGAHRKGR